MCGINGIFLPEGERVDPANLERMTALLRDRGPDAEGIFARGNVGLGHRRLKIIDLSDAANQPLFNETGDVAVSFNGEIYNFQELRAELESAGHVFKTRSDTEVIVHAFEQWGTGSFARFNGMFAFALLDLRQGRKELYLVRDRFGIKPLFYARSEGKLAFSSELKPLLALPWVSRQTSPQTLYYFLKFSHVPCPRSIVEGARQVRPGHWIRFGGPSGWEERCYWDPREASARGARDGSRSESEWLDELEGLLQRVVRRQMISDVPLGCFLSGGIDSSLLVMAHASLGQGPLKTFTIGYKEAEFDESRYAREIAETFGTEHALRVVSADELVSLVPDVPGWFDQPLADPTLLSSLILSSHARKEVTVALSGDGGDELFFGYPHQRALEAAAWVTAIPSPLRRAGFGAIESFARPWSHRLAKLAEIFEAADRAELVQSLVGTIGPLRADRLAQVLTGEVPARAGTMEELLAEVKDLPWREQVIQVFLRTFLVDTVLAKTDRSGMAFGLEARVPFLDNEVVEFSARLPFRYKRRGRKSKYLLRKLLERGLEARGRTASLSARRKQGFSIPLRDWLRGELKYLLDEYLRPERLKREGLLDPLRVRELVRAHLTGAANHSHFLWSLVTFEMWRDRYL